MRKFLLAVAALAGTVSACETPGSNPTSAKPANPPASVTASSSYTTSGWRPIRSRLCLHRDRGRATAQRVHGQEVFSLYLDYLGDDDRITTAALDNRTHPCCPWFDAVTSLRGRREGVETLGRARIVSGSQLCHNRPPRGRL